MYIEVEINMQLIQLVKKIKNRHKTDDTVDGGDKWNFFKF